MRAAALVLAVAIAADGDAVKVSHNSPGGITTGVLGVSGGGTGISSCAAGQLMYASAANTLAMLPAGASGSALVSAGAGAAPGWRPQKVTIPLARALAPNSATGTNPSTAAILLTNLGTAGKYIGNGAIVADLTGYTRIAIVWRARTITGQTGSMTCEVFDVTANSVRVTHTFTPNVTHSVRRAEAVLAATGQAVLALRCRSSVATDDPELSMADVELY